MIGSLVAERIGARAGTTAQEAVSSADVLAPHLAQSDQSPANAYRVFIERNLDEAYRLATFVVGNRADAEDAVHDAAIAAWRHWTERRDESRTTAWFRRIVVNACRDRIRVANRVRTISTAARIEDGHDRVAPDHADRLGERDRIGRLLAGLSLDDRVLLTLRFGLDLTVPAIASVLALREGTVKSRLHRATENARGLLAEAEEPT